MQAQEESAITVKTRFRWTIKNLSSIKDCKNKHYSDAFVDASGDKWRILIFPNGNNKDNDLSLYLDVADSESLPYGWKRYAHFSLSVLNQTKPNASVTKDTDHKFSAETKDWGFTEFMRLNVLYDPVQGFLVNDTLIFEAEVCIDSKKGNADTEVKNEGTNADEEEPSLYDEPRDLKNHVIDEVPQNPHYAPLDKFGDTVRDGMKMGLNIAFMKLSKEIRRLNDPQSFLSNLDGLKKQVTEFEEMGYNVEKLREKLQTLKSVAERVCADRQVIEKFKVEMKEYENKISKLKTEIDTLETNSDDATKEFVSIAKRITK